MTASLIAGARRDYDNGAGIASYLTDLDGLHRLIRERRDAGYERKERLNEFLILGHFWADTCGNFGATTIGYRYSEPIAWMPDALPRVVESERLLSLLPRLTITSTFRPPPPTSTNLCSECGRGWTIANCHDNEVRFGRNDERIFRHKRCAQLHEERESLRELQEIASNAGLDRAVLIPIPGEYDRTGHRTWALLCTPWGDVKIGWRKRVINIDWTDMVERAGAGLEYEDRARVRSVFDGNELFKDDQTTKDATHVHAWGNAKAVEYLRAIYAAAREHGR
ncbi:MAG: hypothetical protein HOW73_47940 [Polyangiaceae bacterium]|nr:hypothetical protein [Polyangiaceae bacterium]